MYYRFLLAIGQPIVDLIYYMEKVHLRHCLPRDLASGMAELPVDYIYIDDNPTSISTTKRLPITGEILSGKNSYKNILPYFTTSEITPERVNEIGKERLQILYPQVWDRKSNLESASSLACFLLIHSQSVFLPTPVLSSSTLCKRL